MSVAQIEREARKLLAEQIPTETKRRSIEAGRGLYMGVTVAQALRALEKALAMRPVAVHTIEGALVSGAKLLELEGRKPTWRDLAVAVSHDLCAIGDGGTEV